MQPIARRGLEDEAVEEGVECGVEVCGFAGMRAGGLKRGAANGCQPTETLLGLKRGDWAGVTLAVGNAKKALELTVDDFGRMGWVELRYQLMIWRDATFQPSPALAHHYQPHVDKLLALDVGQIPHNGIFKQVFLGRRLHG